MIEDSLLTPDGTRHDLAYVHQAEARTHEIAIVTPAKAPELMSTFSRACFKLGRMLRELYRGVEKAKKDLANRKAVMIIDVIPEKMKARPELNDNADTRKAFMDLDADYNSLSEKVIEWEASLVYVQRKLKDMEGALNAVKSAMRDTESVWKRPNYNTLGGGAPGREEVNELVDPSPTQTTGGLKIGRPRY